MPDGFSQLKTKPSAIVVRASRPQYGNSRSVLPSLILRSLYPCVARHLFAAKREPGTRRRTHPSRFQRRDTCRNLSHGRSSPGTHRAFCRGSADVASNGRAVSVAVGSIRVSVPFAIRAQQLAEGALTGTRNQRTSLGIAFTETRSKASHQPGASPCGREARTTMELGLC